MGELAQNRQKMVELMATLSREEGAQASPIEHVLLLRNTCSAEPTPVLYEPCIVIVAQGRKLLHLPDATVAYDSSHYLMFTTPIPAECETHAGREGPFFGMAVRISLSTVSELLLALAADGVPLPVLPERARFLETPEMTAELGDTALRLLEAMLSPADSRVLGPQLVRELLYRVLRGPHGGALRAMLEGDGSRVQIHRLVERMHLRYAAPMHLRALARETGMSTSALHNRFREVMGTSPLQYLKTVRLHRARQRMAQTGMTAAEAAAEVGYTSASQFSREFRRLFGAPPGAEAERIRSVFGLRGAPA